jgi:hypothetical protein
MASTDAWLLQALDELGGEIDQAKMGLDGPRSQCSSSDCVTRVVGRGTPPTSLLGAVQMNVRGISGGLP